MLSFPLMDPSLYSPKLLCDGTAYMGRKDDWGLSQSQVNTIKPLQLTYLKGNFLPLKLMCFNVCSALCKISQNFHVIFFLSFLYARIKISRTNSSDLHMQKAHQHANDYLLTVQALILTGLCLRSKTRTQPWGRYYRQTALSVTIKRED